MAKYLFRVDASTDIGSGHVMRCLTLASALRQYGHGIHFICRDLPGQLSVVLEQHNIAYSLLSSPEERIFVTDEPLLAHSAWLTVSQNTDFLQCKNIIVHYQPDWVVVDHYAISAPWEEKVRELGVKICVIDDLADREHLADILIDQNLGRKESDYSGLVPSHCQSLIGPQFALLRPEFKYWREYSLDRRSKIDTISTVLINLGGVDKDNVTEKMLTALAKGTLLNKALSVIVVMGKTAPHLQQVIRKAEEMPYPTQVLCGVDNMAELMANADLAIGAAGSTSWERCCLGLPTIIVVLAENQQGIAKYLVDIGAAVFSSENGENYHVEFDVNRLFDISTNASKLVDGLGVYRITEHFH